MVVGHDEHTSRWPPGSPHPPSATPHLAHTKDRRKTKCNDQIVRRGEEMFAVGERKRKEGLRVTLEEGRACNMTGRREGRLHLPSSRRVRYAVNIRSQDLPFLARHHRGCLLADAAPRKESV